MQGGSRQHFAHILLCEAALTRVLTTSLAPTISVLVMNRLLAKNRYRKTCGPRPRHLRSSAYTMPCQHFGLAWLSSVRLFRQVIIFSGHMAGKRWPTQCALLPQRTLTTSRIVWAFGARRLIYIQGSRWRVNSQQGLFSVVTSHCTNVQASATQAHRPE